MSAALVIGMVEKLMRFESLTPLTGAPEEWGEPYEGGGSCQNRRCSHVFRRADGTAFDGNGRIFRYPDGGCFTSKGSHVDITFPYTPTREYVDVDNDGQPLGGSAR